MKLGVRVAGDTGAFAGADGDPEIENAQSAIVPEVDVGGLDVAVGNFQPVQRGNAEQAIPCWTISATLK